MPNACAIKTETLAEEPSPEPVPLTTMSRCLKLRYETSLSLNIHLRRKESHIIANNRQKKKVCF